MSAFIRSRTVFLPEGFADRTIRIENGTIAEVLEGSAGPDVLDLGDRWLLPGFIDPHVHFNEPGRTDWEGFATGTRAAIAGGITTVFDMPLNSSPVTTTVAGLEEKFRAATGKLSCDVGVHAGVIPGSVGSIAELHEAGCRTFKVFLCDSGLPEFPAIGNALEPAMKSIARLGGRVLVHAELPEESGNSASSPGNLTEWERSRPESFEVRAAEKLIELCRATGCPLWVVHVASPHALDLYRRAREQDLPIIVETAPHYLVFACDEAGERDARWKCAPPIRSTAVRKELRRRLLFGDIDLVATDHSPCPPVMKRGAESFAVAWGGIVGLQYGPLATWAVLRELGAGADDWVRLQSANPAKALGLYGRKGCIAPGADADFVCFDPEGTTVVSKEKDFHRHHETPYEGMRFPGVVERVWLRGSEVIRGGEFVDPPRGKILTGKMA